MSKFTEEFERIEVNWFYRHLLREKDTLNRKIVTLGSKKLNEQQQAEFDKMKFAYEDINRFATILHDAVEASNKLKVALLERKEELEEAKELNTGDEYAEQACVNEIFKVLEQLQNDRIKLTLDRPVIKFILKIVEADLHNFRTAIIPKYEKADQGEFKDPIFTKTFWINKAIKSKKILEVFKQKLEKGL